MKMACPPGQHQHLGSKGRMLRCHPKSTKHTNERTQQYHAIAIQGDKNAGIDEDFGEETEEKSSLTPEEKKRREQNKKTIISALRRLTRGRAKALFVPLAGVLFAYDNISESAKKYKEKAKSKHDKMMADAYAEAVEEFVDLVPPDDAEWGEETIKRVSEGVRNKADQYRKVVLEKGKDCPEYAKYRAYRDYSLLCDEKMEAIHRRVLAEQRKKEMGAGGSSRSRRMPTGEKTKIPSKEEMMKQYGFGQHFTRTSSKK